MAWIEEQLKTAGFKLSTSRKKIASLLQKKKGLFSAEDLLKKDKTLDKVTVYRNLDLLEKLDIIHRTIQRGGRQFYELHHEKHHHHIMCDSCEKTACVPCDTPIQKQIKGFSKVHHTIIFTGLCATCN